MVATSSVCVAQWRATWTTAHAGRGAGGEWMGEEVELSPEQASPEAPRVCACAPCAPSPSACTHVTSNETSDSKI
jgi:hypothetical protein